MNLLVLSPKEKLSTGEFEITRPEVLDHIRNILNKKEGDCLKAGVQNETLGLFRILSLQEKRILGKFVSIVRPARRIPEVRLLAAVQRPPTVEKIVQLSATWGISNLQFLLADLSRKEYLTSPVWRQESLDRNLLLGMEQGGNIFKPEIELGFTLPGNNLPFKKKESIKDRILRNSDAAFYLEKKGVYLSRDSSFFSEGENCTILLGPEAGWTESELSLFQARGLKPIRLSGSILRSEQALAFFLAQFELEASRK